MAVKGLPTPAAAYTAASGAVSVGQVRHVKVTSEALTTAAGSTYTLTVTSAQINSVSSVYASVAYGTATAGTPVVTRVQVANGTVTILIKNDHASAAFDGTIVVSYFVV